MGVDAFRNGSHIDCVMTNNTAPHHNMKFYVTIRFDSHEYTATVTKPGQLSRFLSDKGEPFRITGTRSETTLPSGGFPLWFIKELNACSRFVMSRNVTASI